VVVTVLLFYRPLKLMSFDPQMAAAAGLPTTFLHYLLMGMLSAVIVAALQSVGVIMSVAMLITPAAIAYQLTNRFGVMLALSAAAGAVSALLGLDLAFVNDWPPGPAMVVVATGLFLVTMALAPEYGILSKAIRRRRVRAHILEEDVLKWLRNAGSRAELANLQRVVSIEGGEPQFSAALETLAREGALVREDRFVRLTEEGGRRADLLVRSHRLWETYLAEQGVPQERIHEEAERLEHAHDLAEEVADELGHPAVDPHGEPIPERSSTMDT
jgi:Mn-dependent DtxR family transcriptional regulator